MAHTQGTPLKIHPWENTVINFVSEKNMGLASALSSEQDKRGCGILSVEFQAQGTIK